MLGEHDRSTVPDEAADESRTATSDDELAVAARHDPAAFEQIYLRYADRIFRFAVGQTRSPSLSEDITGETMVTAFENLHRFDPNLGSFGAWLFTIARRRTVDEQRRTSRFWRALSRRGVDSARDEDALSRLLRSERAEDLHAAVRRLPKRDREIVLLRYVAELTSAEIGMMLNLSPGAVRIRLHRALRRLAGDLGDHDVSE